MSGQRMDVDSVWRHVDEQRAVFADLVESLDEQQLAHPSLCDAWTVRHVVAHLSLSVMDARTLLTEALRARGRYNRMVRDSALRHAARTSVAEDVAAIRALAGTRRKVFVVTPLEPLIDVLVHTQDVARPLGLEVTMPVEAAVAATQRAYSMGFPFWAARRLRGVRLSADDADWAAGDGTTVEAPIAELLLLVTGRSSPRELLSRDRQ